MKNKLIDGELDISKFNTEISKAIRQTKDDQVKTELLVKYFINSNRKNTNSSSKKEENSIKVILLRTQNLMKFRRAKGCSRTMFISMTQ